MNSSCSHMGTLWTRKQVALGFCQTRPGLIGPTGKSLICTHSAEGRLVLTDVLHLRGWKHPSPKCVILLNNSRRCLGM